jgi:hypothetical protein
MSDFRVGIGIVSFLSCQEEPSRTSPKTSRDVHRFLENMTMYTTPQVIICMVEDKFAWVIAFQHQMSFQGFFSKVLSTS